MSTIEHEEKKMIIKMDEIYVESEDMIIGAMLYLNEEGMKTKFLGFNQHNRAIIEIDEVPYSIVNKGTSGRGLDMTQVFDLSQTDVPVNPEKTPQKVSFISRKYAFHYEKKFGKPVQ